VGFEPTIPVFERAKTVHAFDRAAAVIGNSIKFKKTYFEASILEEFWMYLTRI
jgi:hypothetical protein